MNAYTESLLARNDAINGNVKRQVAIGRTSDQVHLTAKAKALVARSMGQVIDVEFAKRDRFNTVIKQSRLESRMLKLAALKSVFDIGIRDHFTGLIRIVRTKATTENAALRQVAKRITKHESAFVIERIAYSHD